MPITSGDISFRLSGGAANATPAASLGGAKSSVSAGASLFDDTSGAESAAGDVEYRCIYVHAAVAATSAKAWIAANTPSSSTDLAIGLGSSALNGTEQTVANEDTAPTGVTFSAAANLGAAVDLGAMTAGSSRALWIRRTVLAAAGAATGDGGTLRITAE